MKAIHFIHNVTDDFNVPGNAKPSVSVEVVAAAEEYVFTRSSAKWREFRKPKCPRLLNWTCYFNEQFAKHNPYCVLTFKENRVSSPSKSRTKAANSKLFTGGVNCKVPGWERYYLFTIDKSYSCMNFLKVIVTVTGTFHHDAEGPTRRPVRRKQAFAQELYQEP